MEENETQVLEIQEQEEISQEVATESEVANEDKVELSKAEYTKLKRQSIAYQSLKGDKSEEKTQKTETPASSDIDIKLTKLELKTEGYTNDEIEMISEFGFEKKNHPIVQKAIEQMRAERKSKEADVSVSNKSAIYKKYSAQDLNNMSVEELRKILPHAD